MVPLKLQLKNFISYGSQVQTICFEPYHLICLSGKNGHGKSALLDALTWALWGQARKAFTPSKADEGLMRLGQTHMMVSLDFRYTGITYRIRREYTLLGAKAVSHLDFGIIDEKTQQIRPLSEKTMRATQEKINQTIRLDYESFINSAFLRQGQSNEFSKKSSRERKEILAAILGIDRYEQLRKKATEKARAILLEKEVLAQGLAALQNDINQKAEVEAALTHINKQLSQNNAREDALKGVARELEERKQGLEAQKQAWTRLALVEEHNRAMIESQTRLFLDKVGIWRSVQHKKKALALVQAATEQRAQLEQRVQQLRERPMQYRRLMEELSTCKDKLQSHKETLIKQQAKSLQEFTNKKSAQETAVRHFKQQNEALAQREVTTREELKRLAQEIELTRDRIKQLTNHTLQDQEKLFERRKVFYHRFIARRNNLQKAMQELDDKRILVETAQACCPLCSQELTSTACLKLKSSFAHMNRLFNHQLSRVILVIQNLKELLLKQHNDIEMLKKEQQERTRLESRLHELIQQKLKQEQQLFEHEQEYKQAVEAYKIAESLLKTIQEQHDKQRSAESYINEDSEYKLLTEGIKKRETHALELAHEDQEYQKACNQLTALTQQSHEHQAFFVELALQEQRKQEIHELATLIKKLKQESPLIHEQLAQFKNCQAHLDNLRLQAEQVSQELKKLVTHKEEFIQKKGALEHHCTLIRLKEDAARKSRVRHTELESLCNEYQALAHALSKDGIQALLIEQAIPEIEQEANALLAKLTDNQAHLTIESLRDLKSGATKETLDIKISDPLGIRPYELFSGGEAFRIDFALRIAISKLLARRAGAALQILIIDEGFGSQDEEGLAHITDALYKIQEDFAKVIIVSHLPIMKEQFPVQFYVFKGPQGSSLQVIEQG